MTMLRMAILIATAALLLPAAALAREKDQGKLELTNRALVGSTQLAPGTYKVEWTGSGPEVQVNFLQHDKTVATARGEVIKLQMPYSSGAVVLGTPKNGEPRRIEQIDFSDRTEALQIEPGMDR
jgi:hypothetical protein